MEPMDIFDTIDINISWKKHIEEVNNRISSMWNYLLYNQFCDKEVINLKNKINELKEENRDIKELQLYFKTQVDKTNKHNDKNIFVKHNITE